MFTMPRPLTIPRTGPERTSACSRGTPCSTPLVVQASVQGTITRKKPTSTKLEAESRSARNSLCRPRPGSAATTSGGRPQLAHLGRHVAEVRVQPVELAEDLQRAVGLAGGLVRHPEVVPDAVVLLLVASRRLQALLEPFHRQ